MIHRVLSNGRLIGTARLEQADAAMGVALGRFDPAPAFELVQSVFLMQVEAMGHAREPLDQTKLEEYWQARDALHLTLQAEDGRIVPTSWINITDWSHLGSEEPCEIEVQIPDAAFWEQWSSHHTTEDHV